MTVESRVIKIYESFILGFCKCGCSTEIDIRRSDGYLKFFDHGHSQKGKYHWKYNDGVKQNDGYNYIYKPNHPLVNPDYPYIAEHRLVYEHYLYILFDEPVYIPKDIEVHHIDENKQNNSLINLIPLTRKQHSEKHYIDTSDRYCSICGSKETYYNKKDNYYLWYGNNENGWICSRCYKKHSRIKKKLSYQHTPLTVTPRSP